MRMKQVYKCMNRYFIDDIERGFLFKIPFCSGSLLSQLQQYQIRNRKLFEPAFLTYSNIIIHNKLIKMLSSKFQSF